MYGADKRVVWKILKVLNTFASFYSIIINQYKLSIQNQIHPVKGLFFCTSFCIHTFYEYKGIYYWPQNNYVSDIYNLSTLILKTW